MKAVILLLLFLFHGNDCSSQNDAKIKLKDIIENLKRNSEEIKNRKIKVFLDSEEIKNLENVEIDFRQVKKMRIEKKKSEVKNEDDYIEMIFSTKDINDS